MKIKLNVHPDNSREDSKYVRLHLWQFLVDQGVEEKLINWRGTSTVWFMIPKEDRRDAETD